MSLLAAAKIFMLSYLEDGQIKQPSNFDEDILGQRVVIGFIDIMKGTIPAWNNTIFCTALGELIDEGKILAWQDKDGKGWMYQILSAANQCASAVAWRGPDQEVGNLLNSTKS